MKYIIFFCTLFSVQAFSMGACKPDSKYPWCPKPKPPCEIDPTLPECKPDPCKEKPDSVECKPCIPNDPRPQCPKPPAHKQTIRAQFLENNATLSSLCFMAKQYDDNKRYEMIRRHKEKELNEIWFYVLNEKDLQCQVEYKSEDKVLWRSWMAKMRADGLMPRIWLFPDDSPGYHKWSAEQVKAHYKKINDDLGDLVVGYTTGLEVDEYWSESKHLELLKYLRSITTKSIGVHTTNIGRISFALNDAADYYFLQTGFGKPESEITKQVKDAINKKGTCKVVLAEYSKSGDRNLGDAGIDAGAVGCGNDCSIKTLNPNTCGVKPPQPPLPGFDWGLVSKWGGPNIQIDKNVEKWEVVSTLHSVSFNGSLLKQERDAFNPVPCKDDLQGNFNACVKQSDGKYICGSWEYERCGGQASGKTVNNLKGDIGKSFNLTKGSEICFFNSGLARSSVRNQEIRTTVKCTIWNY